MEDRDEVLAGISALLRVKPEIHVVCHFGEQWVSSHEPEEAGWAPFHIVLKGECRLQVDGRQWHLRQGDVVLLPHGGAHIVHAPHDEGERRPFWVQHRGALDIPIRINVDAPAATELACGRLRFDQVHHNLILAALPPVVHFAAADGPDAARVAELVRIIRDEIEAARIGSALMARDLASLVMLIVLRSYLECRQQDGGVFALIACKRAGKAFAAMLRHPAREWTLDDLAAEGHTSRATLVRMFRRNVGMAPLTFLQDLRLNLGDRYIRASSLPLTQIAERVGYQSTSAFSRAYLKRFGATPSDIRRAGR